MKYAEQPIYPVLDLNDDMSGLRGLTKREYFAGLAMHGLLSSNAMYNGKTDERALLCQDAIAHADELLKQLEK